MTTKSDEEGGWILIVIVIAAAISTFALLEIMDDVQSIKEHMRSLTLPQETKNDVDNDRSR
jgi:hypothetical protein